MRTGLTKRILIITYEMIPFNDSWGACQRMYYLAEEFAANKYETWVASCKLTVDPNLPNLPVNFNQIIIEHPIKSSQAKSVSQGKPLSYYYHQFFNKLIKPLIFKVERFLLNEPNKGTGIYSYFWVQKAFNELKRDVARIKIDVIIISGPPFTLFIIAKKLKKTFKTLKIVLDYRDPWNLWNNNHYPSTFFERKYLQIADLITVTTGSLRDAISRKFKIENCETIFNGYSEKLWSTINPSKNKSDKIIIAYIGSIHFRKGSYRDTSEFFKAYEQFQDKDLIEIRFIGVDESPEVKKLRIKYPKIVFMKKVSVSKSLELMEQSDYLLNIHTAGEESSKYLIGGKIFDYLRSGNTIISLNYPDSYEHKFLQDKNAILCVNDQMEILNVLNRLINEKVTITDSAKKIEFNEENILKYSREYQNQKYITLVKSL